MLTYGVAHRQNTDRDGRRFRSAQAVRLTELQCTPIGVALYAKNISVRIDDERREELDVLAENAGLSRAAYIRDALDVREKYYELREEHAELREDYEELQTEYESLQDAHTELREEHGECEERIEDLEHEYEERIEELQTEVQRLRREKRQILEQREEHTELVKVVKEEQSLAKRKAQAGLWTKTKWALFGMSDEDSG